MANNAQRSAELVRVQAQVQVRQIDRFFKMFAVTFEHRKLIYDIFKQRIFRNDPLKFFFSPFPFEQLVYSGDILDKARFAESRFSQADRAIIARE